MNKKIIGIPASNGIGFAKVYILTQPDLSFAMIKIKDTQDEKNKYLKAIDLTLEQLQNIKEITLQKLGEEKAMIFDAHMAITTDVEIEREVLDLIEKDFISALNATTIVFDKYHDIFRNSDDAYFKERSSDMIDLKKRIIANLKGVQLPNLALINEEVIIVANDLTPSETALLNKKFVKGFVTEIGGRTSHAAIMARTMEIPAVLSVKDLLSLVKTGDYIALNGDTGEIEINPSNKEKWNKDIEHYKQLQIDLLKYKNLPTRTLDGYSVLLESNIGNPNDAKMTLNYGSEGVGLYRSEFLYMDSKEWPDEETQFQGYKQALECLKDQLVVIRTLDIGGDKQLNYFKFPVEMNPFLGYRAIRLCLDKLDIFKVQLRALGRASAYGKLAIMFPMIATVEEFNKAKNFTLSVFEELKNEGHKVANDIQIGMMIEIPAAALNSNSLSKYSDFFSIGTNDLIQYTMACDRMAKSVAYLYQPNNPSVLKLIKMSIDANKNNPKKWTGMCGEMAGDILSIPILLGFGLNAFSMTPSSILKARKVINNLNQKECIEIANKAVSLQTCDEVNNLVKDFLISKKLF